MASNAATEFSRTLKRLRSKSGKTRYKLAQYSGLDEAYVVSWNPANARIHPEIP